MLFDSSIFCCIYLEENWLDFIVQHYSIISTDNPMYSFVELYNKAKQNTKRSQLKTNELI